MAEDLNIIREVGKSLKKLLEMNKDIKVSFKSPADSEAASNVSLFLYQVAENIHQRNRNFENPDPDRLVYPSVILDLYYIITPYKEDDRESEFDFLEKIISTFYDHAVLRGSVLSNTLLESGNKELRIVPNYLSLEDLNHLWSTFAKPLKTAIGYLVTPVRIPSARELQARRVIYKEDRYYQIVGK